MEIEEFFENSRVLIDDAINDFITKNIEAAAIGVSKYITYGGKRIRGLLVLYTSKLFSGDIERAIRPAVAVELVHASSLALDDIIDLDYRRRGRPAAWIAKGVSKTVLVSNLLIPLAIREVEFLGREAVEKVIDSWLSVTRGEILDVFSEESEYEAIVHLKTASLLQLSLFLGALAAGRKDVLKALERYGLYLGTAYQVADDLVDTREYVSTIDKPKPVQRFLKWLGLETGSLLDWKTVLEMGAERLKCLIREAVKAAEGIGEEKAANVFKALPTYVVEKMLEEGGLKIRLE